MVGISGRRDRNRLPRAKYCSRRVPTDTALLNVDLNMRRITGKAGGDSLIEMSPTDSSNGE